MTTAYRAGAAPVALLLALMTLVGSLPVLAPTWARQAGLEWWEVPAYRKEIEASKELNRMLAAEFEHCRSQQEVKEGLIEELVRGRRSFAAVTLEFLAMNRERPGSMVLIRATYPGTRDEEKVARNVLDYALRRVTGSLYVRAIARARLKAAFERYVAGLAAGPDGTERD